MSRAPARRYLLNFLGLRPGAPGVVAVAIAITVAIAGAATGTIPYAITITILAGVAVEIVEHDAEVADRIDLAARGGVDLPEEFQGRVVTAHHEQGRIHALVDDGRIGHREIRGGVEDDIVVALAQLGQQPGRCSVAGDKRRTD